MPDFADYNDPGATATAIAGTSLTGTGLAKESGGNLDTHTSLLSGTAAGALIAGAGRTIGQEVAAQIATGSAAGTPGGVPHLHGIRMLFDNSGAPQVIAASGSWSPGNITFTRPGYIMRIITKMSALSGVPWVKVNMRWQVAAQGTLDADFQVWYLNAGNNSNHSSHAKGPVSGDTLVPTFFNGDAVNTATVSLTVWESTQAISRHDWRDGNPVPSTGNAAAAGQAQANLIADESISVGAGATAIRNLPLYAGQANVWVNQNTSPGSALQIIPVGAYDQGANPIANLDWTVAPHQLVGVILPRAPCAVFANNTAAGAQTLTYAITALEYAS